MKARDLERLLAKHGVGAAKLDGTTRRLREVGALPKSGRGPNAPDIGPREAATILIAAAGSSKATDADVRLAKLRDIRCGGGSRLGPKLLINAVADLLSDPAALADVDVLRIARTSSRADLIHVDGTVSEFRARPVKGDRMYVEGVLPAELLKIVAQELAASARSNEARRQ